MTGDVTDPGTADRVRSSVEAMAAAVHAAALEGDPWTGDLGAVTHRLHELARVDLCLGRLVEGHADAVRILDQAGRRPEDGVYGVWASRSAGTGVRAVHDDGRWCLRGQVRFASGIDLLDRALVPGWVDGDTHLLFDVPVAAVQPDRTSWHTAAMDGSRSFTVEVDSVVGEPVGPESFYLSRPGFVLGGLQVAAVWAGGVASVVDLVATGLRDFAPSAHQLRRLGAMEQASWTAETALAHAVRRVAEASTVPVADITAARSAVVAAGEQVLDEAGRIVGPGGLSTHARLPRTLADLSIYLRQHHLDLTFEALGRESLQHRRLLG